MITQSRWPAVVGSSTVAVLGLLFLLRPHKGMHTARVFHTLFRALLRRKAQATGAMAASAAVVFAARQLQGGNVDAVAVPDVSPVATGGIVGALRSLAVTSAKYIDHQRDLWQLAFEKRLEKRLNDVIQMFAAKLKGMVQDPDMPAAVLSLIDETVDRMLPDVRAEVYARTSEVLLTPVKRFRLRTVSEVKLKPMAPSPPPPKTLGSQWWAFRAALLYEMSPYDKSVWACLRNPTWWALNGIGLIPGVNHLWWLLLFVLKDTHDEYQVADFIVGFEAAKFFSVGMWSLLMGGLRSYVCLMPTPHTCHVSGPAVSVWDAVAFFVQITLVWLAFWMLPVSTRRRPARTTRLVTPLPGSTCGTPAQGPPHGKPGTPFTPDVSFWRSSQRHARGGVLRRLFVYDTVIFGTAVVLGVAAVAIHTEHWKLLSSLYWIRVLYGLLSLPFLVFKVPWVMRLFVCPASTGYNQLGQTVLTVRRRVEGGAAARDPAPVDGGPTPTPSRGWTWGRTPPPPRPGMPAGGRGPRRRLAFPALETVGEEGTPPRPSGE